MSSSSTFGGERYLQTKIPDYEQECHTLTIYLVLGFVFWFVVYPFVVATEVPGPKAVVKDDKKTISITKDKKKKEKNKKDTSTTTPATPPPPPPLKQVSLSANMFGIFGFAFTSVSLILLLSPHNYFAPRRVFVFPIFTPQECQEIIAMADQAADANYLQAQEWSLTLPNGTDLTPEAGVSEGTNMEQTYKTFLQTPLGWHKLRHGNYPTTDLNPVTDPFSAENRTYLTEIFNRRLAPTLQRLYGIPIPAFRAVDMFVVRYDEDIRTHLEKHTDDGDVSFTILLNDQFQGGGTRFWRRQPVEEPFAHVTPSRGTALTNHALINHEGYHVESGTRLIFVGFTNVDFVDPWTHDPTGLTWYGSWLNIAWLNVKFKRAYFTNGMRLDRNDGRVEKWFDHRVARLLFRDVTNLMEYVGDVLSPHQVENLVADEDVNAFLQALDEAYEQKEAAGDVKVANWWKGQMVNLDITGSVDSYWSIRYQNSHRFTEL